MTITLEVPIEEGELFEKAVDKAAATLSGDANVSNAVHDSKTDWCAVQADAAIVMAKAYLSGITWMLGWMNASTLLTMNIHSVQPPPNTPRSLLGLESPKPFTQ